MYRKLLPGTTRSLETNAPTIHTGKPRKENQHKKQKQFRGTGVLVKDDDDPEERPFRDRSNLGRLREMIAQGRVLLVNSSILTGMSTRTWVL